MIWPTCGRRIETGRRRFERGQRTVDLALLQVEPFLLVLFRRPVAAFVDDEDRRIHDAVGERLQLERGEAVSKSFGMILPPPAR